MVTTFQQVPVDYWAVQPAGADDGFNDERLLVEQARSNSEAFATLYRLYLPRIHAFAYRRSSSREIAEDVTAATFERAYRQLDKFEWRGGGFGAWLFRIAANELADHYRRQQRSQSDRGQIALGSLHNESQTDDLEKLERDARSQELIEALGTIKPRYQEAISLRYLAGLSHEEAAEAMGVTKPVMAVTLTRALKALKKVMEKVDHEESQ